MIKKLNREFPGCFVLNNDASHVQGIPDILILFEDKWAMLEVKMESSSNIQPNQAHYIQMFDEMSFASFINPQIERDVLDELQRAFGLRR